MRLARLTATTAGTLLLLGSGLRAQETLLHSGDAIDGIRISTGGRDLNPAVQINRDPRFISEGTGSIHVTGVKPAASQSGRSAYVAIDIPLAPSSWEGMALAFDAWSSRPAATKGFYVRGLNASGQQVASWMTWNADRLWEGGRASIELIPKLSADLAWEAGEIRSEDRSSVTTLRVFVGTRDPGATFDAFIDNIRLRPSQVRLFHDAKEAAPLHPDTVLVQGGVGQAVIVVPDADAWQALGVELAQAVADATGATLPVKRAGELGDEDLHQTNAILLGSVVNNRRLLYSYTHRQVFADDFHPGPGGHDLRSVHDPWGTGRNLVSIGAMDVEGARAGVAALTKHFGTGPDLIIPRLLAVRLTGQAESRYGRQFAEEPAETYVDQQMEAAESGLRTGVHTGLFGQARNVGLLYAMTRKPAYAQAFVRLIQRAKEHHDTKPDTYGGPWGMDSDFAIFGVMPAWEIGRASCRERV